MSDSVFCGVCKADLVNGSMGETYDAGCGALPLSTCIYRIESLRKAGYTVSDAGNVDWSRED